MQSTYFRRKADKNNWCSVKTRGSKASLQSQDAGLEARVSASLQSQKVALEVRVSVELDARISIPQQCQNAGLEARVQHYLND